MYTNENYHCKKCQTLTQDAVDYLNGTVICTRCGLCLEVVLIVTTAEWRNFSDGDGVDRSRTGGIIKPSAAMDNVLSLGVSGSPSNESTRHLQWNNKTLNKSSDASLLEGMKKIRQWSSLLNFQSKIIDTAEDLLQRLKATKETLRGRTTLNLAAGALFQATRHHQWPIQLVELARGIDVPQKKLKKAWAFIRKQTGSVKSIDAKTYAQNFGDDLKLPQHLINAARELVKRMDNNSILSGKQPATIAAVALYAITQLTPDSKDKKTFSEVACAANLSGSTVKQNYKIFLPFRFENVIPEWVGRLDITSLGC